MLGFVLGFVMAITSSWRAIQQDSLRLRNTEGIEQFRMLDGELNDLEVIGLGVRVRGHDGIGYGHDMI